MRCSTGLLRESIHRALTPRLTAQIACRPMVQALNRFAGSSDRFAPVSLEALTFAQAKLPQRTIAETLANEYATDPVVTAVMAGAVRYIKRRGTNSELDKKIR
jgi:hypothetical protein